MCNTLGMLQYIQLEHPKTIEIQMKTAKNYCQIKWLCKIKNNNLESIKKIWVLFDLDPVYGLKFSLFRYQSLL